HRPRLAPPCRDILPRWRPLQISNPQPLSAHVVYCFPICLARLSYQALLLLIYSLQALIISFDFRSNYPRASDFQQTRGQIAPLLENAVRELVARITL